MSAVAGAVPEANEANHKVYQLQVQINFLAEQNRRLEDRIEAIEREMADKVRRDSGRETT